MKNILKITILLIILFIKLSESKAQIKPVILDKQSYTDSLYSVICAPIYYAFYTPSYMSTTTPTFTMLKIDINKNGKVTGIGFSDSADSTFVNAYSKRKKWPNEFLTIEKYAKAKKYKDVSLLMPISFEPNYPNSVKDFLYSKMESILQFNGKVCNGSTVFLQPMNVRILSSGNM